MPSTAKFAGFLGGAVESLRNRAGNAIDKALGSVSNAISPYVETVTNPAGPALDAGRILAKARENAQFNAQQAASNDVLRYLGLAAGTGIAARSLYGLAQQFRSNTGKDTGPGRLVPIEVEEVIEQTKARQKSRRRRPGAPQLKAAESSLYDWLVGKGATNPHHIPLFYPAAATAVLGGYFGGKKLMDKALDMRKRKHLQQQLDAARQDYYSALLGDAEEPKVAAAATELEIELEKLADDMVELLTLATSAPPAKEAAEVDVKIAPDAVQKLPQGWLDTFSGETGRTLGLYGTLALLLATPAAVAGWRNTRARQPGKVLDEALSLRARERYGKQPPPVFAVPAPRRRRQEEAETF